ncbi:transcriptional repressor [Anaerolentibacter hominis]|uniref:Fur family transcriptional regulator n=1 Tax=Anaerolentibacter hominis TaxID=3079009 RepID=UPI0031B84288
MPALKFSRQREAIKTYLAGTKEHPTADTVYSHIREIYPNISLGTVYRNLNLLTDTGEIQKLSCGESGDRFDGNASPHYHFICNKCHRVLDLDLPDMDMINEMASKSFDGKIEGHSTYFYGICGNCCKTAEN